MNLVAKKYGDIVVGKLVYIYLNSSPSNINLYFKFVVLCKKQDLEKYINAS